MLALRPIRTHCSSLLHSESIAHSTAACACNAVVSNTGNTESSGLISSVISVQPRITACAPRAASRFDHTLIHRARSLVHFAVTQLVVNDAMHVRAFGLVGNHAFRGRSARAGALCKTSAPSYSACRASQPARSPPRAARCRSDRRYAGTARRLPVRSIHTRDASCWSRASPDRRRRVRVDARRRPSAGRARSSRRRAELASIGAKSTVSIRLRAL